VSSRRTLILIAAIVVGALAAYAVVTYVGGIEDRANDNARRVPVLRVSGDIPRGTRGQEALDQGLIEEEDIASEFLPATAISPEAVDTILTKAAVADLATGQVLVENMFVDPIDSQITAARRIATGNVAITISVDNVRGVAGLIVPGDFVNIMGTSETGACDAAAAEGEDAAPADPAAGDSVPVTAFLCRQARYLFQEVQVLFVDRSPIPLPGEQATASSTNADGTTTTTATNTGLITFQVPPEAAQILASAPPDSFHLTLLPPDYTPLPIPIFDTSVGLLPGEDPARLTPYGPNGLTVDETP
jgi:Flp pilus assembly protein CpaB